jgi:ribonuclease HI
MIIYTDGSAHPNPGPGGYGVVVFDDKNNIISAYTHQEEHTTNNEQELKAILYSFLMYGKKEGEIPVIYSDSAYAINTFTNWMYSWERQGWRKADKKVPENLELIQAYWEREQKGYKIDLRKIKGHIGHLGNELADKLATGALSPEEVMMKYGK